VAVTDIVHSSQRTSKNRRCVICGGAATDVRGKNRRCYGYTSSDRKYAHCTREEHAGALPINEDSKTYAHRLNGLCGCGTAHGPDDPVEWNNIEIAYDYRDERGRLLYQVVRKIPKDFRQRKPDGAGGWIWSIGDVRRIIYRLPHILKAPLDQPIYIVEGEKDAERLASGKLVATTNPQGAGKWHFVDECARKALYGRHLVIIADADEAGRDHARQVKEWALAVAASVRVLELYPDDSKRDVSDWLDDGHSIEELQQVAASVEPTETGIHADPWQQELAKAREDVDRALGSNTLQERRPLFALDATELLKIEFPPAPWLVSGLITKGGTAVAAGEPKAGIKTWMLIELAVAIATGTRAFGEFYAEQGRVAFFFAEDQAQSVRNRVRAILAGGDRMIAPSQLLLQPRGEFIDVMKDDDLAWVIASARRLGKIDMLVLDPLRDVHSGEEDKSDSMRDVMRRLRLLGEVIGCTVAVSHHVPKQTKDTAARRPGQNLRGSSAIHGSIDSGLYIQPADSGDGTTTFAAGVISQVKNARSAGAFGLELAITDDANGEAVRARWVHSTDAPEPKESPGKVRKAEKDAADDEKLLAFIKAKAERGEHFTARALRQLATSTDLNQYRTRNAIERLLKAKRVFIADDKVHVPGVE
jgi:5S rRNA maturation endonuclease (ribonuclease M5)